MYDVPVGQPLEKQPGWRALLPAKNALVRDISITQTAVTVKVRHTAGAACQRPAGPARALDVACRLCRRRMQLTTATGNMATFTTPAYISDATKQPLWFGPTLKARAGDRITIRLTNDLVQEERDEENKDAWGERAQLAAANGTAGQRADMPAPSPMLPCRLP